MQGRVRIEPVRREDELAVARALVGDYVASLGIDLSFQQIEAELAGLPGAYAPPTGDLLLARDPAGAAIGCVALRGLGPARCEMKRLYVTPEGRGTGAGRALAEAVLALAVRLGYREMVLDTLPTLTTAMGLYRRLGFEEIAPYYESPVAGAMYFRRALD